MIQAIAYIISAYIVYKIGGIVGGYRQAKKQLKKRRAPVYVDFKIECKQPGSTTICRERTYRLENDHIIDINLN